MFKLCFISAMVRQYKKKSTRVKASPTKLKKGLDLIRKGYSLRIAAKETGVQYSCLFRLHKKTKDVESVDDIPKGTLKLSHCSRNVFPDEVEDSIAEYCKEIALVGYGLPTLTVREVAYDTAVMNKPLFPSMKLPKNWEDEKLAGIDWCQGQFLDTPLSQMIFLVLFESQFSLQ